MSDLTDRLLHFLATPDRDKGGLLDAWPDLLSDAALQQLDSWAAAEADPAASSKLSEVRKILAAIREQAAAVAASPELAELMQQLSEPLDASRIHQRVVLAERALALVDRNAQPELWAGLMIDCGGAMAIDLTGDRARNVEAAIETLQAGLRIATRDCAPAMFGLGMIHLGTAYRSRETGNRAENTEKAIEYSSAGFDTVECHEIPGVRAIARINLGYAYLQRAHGDRADNFERAIEAFSQVIAESSGDHSKMEKASAMAGLGAVYSHRIRGQRAENLENSIQLLAGALEIFTRAGSAMAWGEATMNLGTAYLLRIAGERAGNIERAIECYTSASDLFTRGAAPSYWAKATAQLGSAYQARVQGDRSANIEKAIECYMAALEVQTRSSLPLDWARTTGNLGITHRIRIAGIRAENVDRAIQLMEESLTVAKRETSAVEWASVTANLANAYLDRPNGDRADNLEQAIRYSLGALEVLTRDAAPLEYSRAMQSLGIVMLHRVRGDRAANQEAAIEYFEKALELRRREDLPVDWAVTLMNLGTVYMSRVLGGRISNQRRAIECFEQALEVLDPATKPVEWAGTLMNLGSAFGQLGDDHHAAHKERAIECLTQACAALASGSNAVQHFTCLMNLGTAYQARVYGERTENLGKSIECHSAALEVMTRDGAPVQWATNMLALGNACFGVSNEQRPENLAKARRCYLQALEVMTAAALPAEYVKVQRSLGLLQLEEHRWSEAAAAFRSALNVNESLYRLAITSEERIGVLRNVSTLSSALAYCVAKEGTQESARRAAAIVDAGRARWLEEALELRQTLVAGLPESEREQFVELRGRIHTLQAEARKSSEPGQRSYLEVRTDLERALEALRNKVPPAAIEDWGSPGRAAIPPSATVLVYLIATEQGGLALLLQGQEIQEIWLPELVASTVTQMAVALIDRPAQTVDAVSGWLWTAVIEGLLPELDEDDEVLFVPCGLLSLLPLHAAWTPDPTSPTGRRYALDRLRCRYLPRAIGSRSNDASPVTDSILVVDEPLPVSAARLDHSEQEAVAALSYFSKGEALTGEAATREAIIGSLARHSIWHFSCHGGVSFDDPLLSGLLMADDTWLTLRDFLELPSSRIRLAVLSACQTGVHDLRSPDEMLGLPAGLLQAGAEAVIASLWPVVDVSTMMLMARFYSVWKRDRCESSPPHLALREAQQWVRDTTNAEKEDFIRSLASGLEGAALSEFSLGRDADSRQFAHPYFWAAFTYTGL